MDVTVLGIECCRQARKTTKAIRTKSHTVKTFYLWIDLWMCKAISISSGQSFNQNKVIRYRLANDDQQSRQLSALPPLIGAAYYRQRY